MIFDVFLNKIGVVRSKYFYTITEKTEHGGFKGNTCTTIKNNCLLLKPNNFNFIKTFFQKPNFAFFA